MADIDVVPKHRSYTWLWVALIVIAIVLLVWAFNRRSPAAGPQGSLTPGVSAPAVLAEATPVGYRLRI